MGWLRIALGVALALLQLFASADAKAPQSARKASNPWPGLVCPYTRYIVVAEIGAQCRAGQDAEFQGELRQSIARLEHFITQNSTNWTAKKFEDYRAHEIGGPGSLVCSAKTLKLYETLRAEGAAKLRADVEWELSRSNNVWGSYGGCAYDLIPQYNLEHKH